MKAVSDAFLLQVAEVSATLLGLLLVGVFFYLETGLKSLVHIREEATATVRAATKLIIFLYSMALGLSLALVALERTGVIVVFVLLGLGLIVAAMEATSRQRPLSRVVRTVATSAWFQAAGWIWLVAILGVPWVLGGLSPSREEFTWSVLLAGTLAFVHTGATVLSAFDISRVEGAARAAQESS